MGAGIGKEVCDLFGRMAGMARFKAVNRNGGPQAIKLLGIESGKAISPARMRDERERAAGMATLTLSIEPEAAG